MTKILFICHSPMAEFVMKLPVKKAHRPGEEVADLCHTGDFLKTWRDILEGCAALLDRLTR